jgi:DNA helicase IV
MTLLAVGGGVFAWFGPLSRLRVRQQQNRQERLEKARTAYDRLREARQALFGTEYLAESEVVAWRTAHQEALRLVSDFALLRELPEPQASEARAWTIEFMQLPRTVAEHNRRFLSTRLAEEQGAFDAVETNPLTLRQREAIVTNEDTTLVNAGAGTGKTSTIVGKVDYLIRRQLARPDEILVLAFARKASEELKDRLIKLRGYHGVQVSTFHSLGLGIVGTVEGKRPALSRFAEDDRALSRFFRERVAAMLAQPQTHALLLAFFSSLLDEEPIDPGKVPDDEFLLLQKSQGLRDLTGQKLKSREEVQIANWLTLSGIAWEYERVYPVDTRSAKYRQYKPDFYLPQHDIYIEHYGVDANGNTRPGIDKECYRQGMAWKRAFHAEHGTRLVETYSYFARQGRLIEELAARLAALGVSSRQLADGEIQELVTEANRSFSDFVKLLSQFLSLTKGNGRTPQQLSERVKSKRDEVFLRLFLPMYEEYEAVLTRSGEIDFNDMINRAREFVSSGRYPCAYKYIVVDEFQDSSENRLGLLQQMRSQVPHGRLFVVGDDWQAIYRFTGSDTGLIIDLQRHVGATARVDLDTTFRYHQELLDFSAQFVMQNPRQLKKTLRSHHGALGQQPVCVVFQQGIGKAGLPAAIDTACRDILGSAKGKQETAFVLGRYHFNQPEDMQEIATRLGAGGIAVEYLTAHASKGKEADYVIVLGLEAGEYGFPSNVSDDAVLKMVLTEPEPFAYAEERRLFYVAVTRAKKRVYLIAPQDNASPFVQQDILGSDLRSYITTLGKVSSRYLCPVCNGKTIRRTEGRYGAFWACSNYPACEGKLDACPCCKEGGLAREARPNLRAPLYRCTLCTYEAASCPRCHQGYLREKAGKYGQFLGCSHWNGGMGCTYTRAANSS